MLTEEGDVKGGFGQIGEKGAVNSVDIFQGDLNSGGCIADINWGGEKRVLEVR